MGKHGRGGVSPPENVSSEGIYTQALHRVVIYIVKVTEFIKREGRPLPYD